MKYPLTNSRWQAIRTNDSTKDGQFFYGVTTTKIFCKPSCISRLPNKEHILIFKDTTQALKAGFRPCKRCCPTGTNLSNDDWVIEIDTYLTSSYQKPLSLETIAQNCHGSVSNLQRTYKKITGLSPTEKLNLIRLQHSQELLANSQLPIKVIALRCGFNSASYFNTAFKKQFNLTPLEYKKTAEI